MSSHEIAILSREILIRFPEIAIRSHGIAIRSHEIAIPPPGIVIRPHEIPISFRGIAIRPREIATSSQGIAIGCSPIAIPPDLKTTSPKLKWTHLSLESTDSSVIATSTFRNWTAVPLETTSPFRKWIALSLKSISPRLGWTDTSLIAIQRPRIGIHVRSIDNPPDIKWMPLPLKRTLPPHKNQPIRKRYLR